MSQYVHQQFKKKLYQMITMIIIAATVTDGLLHN